MKKLLATALAASMAMGLAGVSFAATTLTPNTEKNKTNYTIDFKPATGTHGNRTEYKISNVLYNYGKTDEATVQFLNTTGVDKIRADVTAGKVKVNWKSSTSILTIKANAGLRDFDEDDYTVDVDVQMKDSSNTKDYTFFIKGKVAYSHMREVSDDERFSNKDADDQGCMYEFDSVLSEETRIRCNEYVDVYFKGNYGTDKENMRVWTDEITEVETYFKDVDVDYYDFRAEPKFATKVKVMIDADANSFVYSYNKTTGDLTRIEAKYESDGWAFTTKVLGCYIVVEEEYEAGNVKGA